MSSRLPIALLFASTFSVVISYAQQETTDVVIGLIRDNQLQACGVDGQVFLYSQNYLPDHDPSITRVSRDGSKVKFSLPDQTSPSVVAAYEGGVNILSSYTSRRKDGTSLGRTSEMYHFDSQANLLAQYPVSIDFQPTGMAVTSSGKTILVGHTGSTAEDFNYGGAVLDAHDRLIKRFELPLPPEGGGWTFASRFIAAGDEFAYVMLHSNEPLATAIGTISETGQVNVKIVPEPVFNEQRHHNEWVFGPGVAVEVYHIVGERAMFRFDEYELSSGNKIATKSAHISGGGLGCYTKDEVSMLAASFHEDPSRHLSPDTERLVFSTLH